MRPRTLLVLFVIVAGLLAFIWFYERELPSSEERRELADRVLRLDPEEVEAVEVEREGDRARLERRPLDGGGAAAGSVEDREWWLVEPLEARADRGAADELVETLTSLRAQRRLEAAALDELGLDPPRARVWIDTGSGRTELLLGSAVPASSSMIVAVAGRDEALVVDDSLWERAARSPGEWRSREVFPGARSDVDRVALESGGERLLLARRGAAFWIEAPVVDRADQGRVDGLLAELTGLRVESFLDRPEEAPEELGLEPALGAVEVILRPRPTPFRLELGAPVAGEEGRRWARAEGRTFSVEVDAEALLPSSVSSWRSRSWTSLASYEVDRVAITGEWGEAELVRRGPDWLLDGEEIPFEPASDLLYGLTDVEALEILAADGAARAFDAGEPVVEIALATAGDDGEGGEREWEERLRLYPPRAEGWPARVEGREVVLLLDGVDVENLRERTGALLDAASGGDGAGTDPLEAPPPSDPFEGGDGP